MPQIWNNMVVVTIDELIPTFFPSREALKLKLWRDSKKAFGIKRAQRGGGLDTKLLIDFDTLPEEWRNQLGDPRKVDCSLELFFWEDKEAVTFFSEISPSKYGNIDPERQKEYVLDASVMKAAIRWRVAHTEECIKRNVPLKNTYKLLSTVVNNFNEFRSLKQLPLHKLPSNHISLKRKIERFEKEGYSSMLKGYDNNNRGQAAEQTRLLLESMFTHQSFKPSSAEVYRQLDGFLSGYVQVINNETGEIFDPKDFKRISQRSITMFLNSWNSSLATSRKRTGNRQIRLAQFVPFEKLAHPRFAGSIISVDDRQPPFEYKKGSRMWFYLGVDLGSEAIVTWVYGTSKEGIILDFYRQMVRNYAMWGLPLPAEIECESNLNADYRDGFLKEGSMFQTVRIEANSARSKRCEAYWKPIRYQLEKQHIGWIARPFARSEANQAGTDKKEIVPYEKLVEQCLRDIETCNNMECTIYPGKTRWEVFMEKQNPDNNRPINYKSILLTLGYKTASSCNKAGQIRFRKDIFLLADGGELVTGERLIRHMQVLAGRDIDIYWLDDNNGDILAAVACLKDTTRVVCELVRQPETARAKIEETPQQARNRELFARYRATLEGYSQRRYHAIEKVTVIDNRDITLNKKFSISGLNRYKAPETEEETEILEEVEETAFEGYSNPVQRSYVRGLSERF